MITNESGQIAVKWVLPRNPPPVKVEGTDRVYIFIPKLHIWMAWIDQEDVDRLLVTKAKVCNCNNGTYKIAFEPANELDVNLWMWGNREGKEYVKET